MPDYPDYDLNYFRDLLQKEKRDLQQKNHGGIGEQVSFKESIQELSLIDNHPADVGSELFERSKDLSLDEKRLNTLQEIDRALQRIEQGEFGTCIVCGRQIDRERLEAIPYTPYCLTCRQGREKEGLKREGSDSDRPVEEQNLYPPFKRTFLQENTWFDGKDAWDQVAEYGSSSTLQDNLPDYDEDLRRGEGDKDNAEVRGRRKKPLI
ncbi:MAG TPA: hypothetical protein GXZ24_01585 [Firmicutes bacterium]|nr:hypothetical protein [Bacillota bacterium]